MSIKQLIKNQHISSVSAFADTKVYSVLKQFTVYELNRLKKFVDSPYFNRNQGLTRMLHEIDLAIRGNKAESLTKEQLWAIASESDSYNDLNFRKLCSDLLKLIERFLIEEEFESNQLQQAEYFLRAVHNRNLTSLESTALRSAERLTEQYRLRPASYYYSQYAFQREIFSLSELDIRRGKRANIEEIASNLDKFFIAEKLRYFIDVLSRQPFQAEEYDLKFMNEIINHLEQNDYSHVVPINLYYQTYLTYTRQDVPTHFTRLKAMIQEFSELLPMSDAKEIMFSALNYCINQVNKGDRYYLRQYLELSEFGIKREFLLNNGELSPWTYRNVVVIGLRLGDFDWVEKFIHSNKYQIDEKYRDNAVSFNLANLYFYQRDYAKVLELLQSVEYEDPSYNLNSKTILMATYYETEEMESLSSLLSSFEMYLRRKKEIPADRKQHYMQLIRCVRSLIRITPSDTKALEKLRKRIDDTETVVNKDWLLQKIDELL